MSRAFTKEEDAGDDLPERPIPEGPNYVTPRGLELLKQAGQELVARRQKARASGAEIATFDRDLRYLEARINSAIVVPAGSGPEIRFGARVELEDETGKRFVYRVVGADEARTDPSFLPWSAPLALALMGAKAGESVTLDSEESPARYKIIEVAW